jgi:hypothetical protein
MAGPVKDVSIKSLYCCVADSTILFLKGQSMLVSPLNRNQPITLHQRQLSERLTGALSRN